MTLKSHSGRAHPACSSANSAASPGMISWVQRNPHLITMYPHNQCTLLETYWDTYWVRVTVMPDCRLGCGSQSWLWGTFQTCWSSQGFWTSWFGVELRLPGEMEAELRTSDLASKCQNLRRKLALASAVWMCCDLHLPGDWRPGRYCKSGLVCVRTWLLLVPLTSGQHCLSTVPSTVLSPSHLDWPFCTRCLIHFNFISLS